MTVQKDAKKKTFTFHPLYSGGSLIVAKYDLPIVLDIDGATLPETAPACFMHEPKAVAGTLTKIWVETNASGEKAIWADGEFALDEKGVPRYWARHILAEKLFGQEMECSIRTEELPLENLELVPPGEEAQANGKTFVGPLYIARKWEMVEGSFVNMGGDAWNAAEIAARLKGFISMNKELAEYIASLGFEPGDLPAESIAIFERCMKDKMAALEAKDVAADAPADDDQKADDVAADGDVPADDDKKADDVAADGDVPADDKKDDVAANCDTPADDKKPGVAAYSAFKPRTNPARQLSKGAQPQSSGAPSINRAYTAALLMNCCGMSEKEVAAAGKFNDSEMSEALGAQFRGVDFRQMLVDDYERRRGLRYRGNTSDFAADVFQSLQTGRAPGVAASYSTLNPLAIFDDTFSLSYRHGFESFQSIIEKICSRSAADNFQKQEYVSYDIRAPKDTTILNAGEITNAELVSEKWENQIDERGMMLTITERMIIDDRLNALGLLNRKFGLKEARIREAMGWKKLLANLATIFTVERGNRINGTLSVTTLGLASDALGSLPTIGSTTDNPEFTEEYGRFLLVPTALKGTAKTLYNNATCDLIGLGEHLESNPYVGEFEPLATPYLGSKVTNGSDAHFFLIGDPLNAAVLDFAELKGQNGPRVERCNTPGNILGISWRSVYRYGFGIGDWRGGVYVTGSAG